MTSLAPTPFGSAWEVLPSMSLEASLMAQASVDRGELSSLCLELGSMSVSAGSLALRPSTPTCREAGAGPDAAGTDVADTDWDATADGPSFHAVSETVQLAFVQGLQMSLVPPTRRRSSSSPSPSVTDAGIASQAGQGHHPPSRPPTAQTLPRQVRPTAHLSTVAAPAAAASEEPSMIPTWVSLGIQNVSLYADPGSLGATARFLSASSATPSPHSCTFPAEEEGGADDSHPASGKKGTFLLPPLGRSSAS